MQNLDLQRNFNSNITYIISLSETNSIRDISDWGLKVWNLKCVESEKRVKHRKTTVIRKTGRKLHTIKYETATKSTQNQWMQSDLRERKGKKFNQPCRLLTTTDRDRDRDRERDRDRDRDRDRRKDEKWKGQGGHHNCRVCFSDADRPEPWGLRQISDYTHTQEPTPTHTHTHTHTSQPFNVYCY